MSTKHLIAIDLVQNELQNARVQNLSSDPSSPVEGQVYWNTTSHVLMGYNGSAFAAVGAASYSADESTLHLASTTFSIKSTYVGQTSITTLGTITTGVWNGTALTATYLPALNAITAPAADVSFNSHKITSLATPTAGTDAATKAYVDGLIQGAASKPDANYATTGALAANTYNNGTSGVGATLTGNSNGALASQDGQTVNANDLILVKNEATAANNGLYVVTQVGDGSHPYILTRHVDFDQTADLATGSVLAVIAGTTLSGSLWYTGSVATIGTTAVSFTEMNKAADLSAGTGITITGNSVAVASAYAGNGIGTVSGIAKGNGSGTITAATLSDLRTLGAASKYSALVGDGAATSIAITQGTHGLASNGQMTVQLFDASTGAMVMTDVSINNSNGTVTLTFTTAPASNAYRVVIVG